MNQKIENELNLALDIPESERERTNNLNTGYDSNNGRWELIVRYSGNITDEVERLGGSIRELLGGYGIVMLPKENIGKLADNVNVLFVEKASVLFYEREYSVYSSCIIPLQRAPLSLTGAGTYIAVIDSGIDYMHPEFRKKDGLTRIRVINNQENGNVYYEDDINNAIMNNAVNLAPDKSGHGTHVAGIAAGNNGVAPEADIIAVRLGEDRYFNTARLMEAVDFCVRYAMRNEKPLAVNLSFGNNYGAHDGMSLIETYLDYVSSVWKVSIAAGTGNEADKRIHASGKLDTAEKRTELAVGRYESSLNIQLWKKYGDDFSIRIADPSGNITDIRKTQGTEKYHIGGNTVYVYYGEPSPYRERQEILFQIIPDGCCISEGLWNFMFIPERIISGYYDMWLSESNFVNGNTGFTASDPDITLTIPSTAYKVISVGAYDAERLSYAPFSGRGYTLSPVAYKPDITAPGVGIISAQAGIGGYAVRSGTSMAVPFVTGSAALLMEWGIVKGNDPFMYGEKIRAALIAGASRVPGVQEWPDRRWGWGTLCVSDSLFRR